MSPAEIINAKLWISKLCDHKIENAGNLKSKVSYLITFHYFSMCQTELNNLTISEWNFPVWVQKLIHAIL